MAEKVDTDRIVNVVIVGHVDSGKSTLTGRLIFELGGIDERAKAKLEAIAAENNKPSFAFAYFMDTGKEERERGITITCQTQKFKTEKFDYTITDAPGHRDFINNMISGAGQADVAVLMVPGDGNFEASIARADPARGIVEGQTRQHSRLINLLGIKQIIVCVNKMDAVKYSEERFNEIKSEVSLMIQQAGYHPETVPFIPLSGWQGDNLTEPTKNMPWYKGWTGKHGFTAKRQKKGFVITGGTEVKGFTLVNALNDYMQKPTRDNEGALRMSVSNSRQIKGVGLVTMGRVEVGTVNIGDEVFFARARVGGKVFSIEMHHESVEAGIAGFNVGIVVKLPKGTNIKRGDLMYRPGDFKDTPELLPRGVKSFKAQVQVENHPGELKVGFQPMMCVRTGRSASRVDKIHYVIGQRTSGQKLENPEFVKKREMAEITFSPQQFLYLEPNSRCDAYGRVAGMDSNTLVMMGKVLEVEYEQKK